MRQNGEQEPELPVTGTQLSDFVAEGWEILDCVELDFNQDGIVDYVGVPVRWQFLPLLSPVRWRFLPLLSPVR